MFFWVELYNCFKFDFLMVLASVETCLAISVTFGRSLKLSEPTDPPSHQDGKTF